MSLNNSVPNLANGGVSASSPANSPNSAKPDYIGLVNFLVQPFLESPSALRVDCEVSSKGRVWIRLAFEGTDKGRVFGRGGRNIQAIRTVLQGVAQAVGQMAHLDIYSEETGGDRELSEERPSRPPSSRSTGHGKPIPKPRSPGSPG